VEADVPHRLVWLTCVRAQEGFTRFLRDCPGLLDGVSTSPDLLFTNHLGELCCIGCTQFVRRLCATPAARRVAPRTLCAASAARPPVRRTAFTPSVRRLCATPAARQLHAACALPVTPAACHMYAARMRPPTTPLPLRRCGDGEPGRDGQPQV
jgi:hypothetical protein